MMKINNKTLTYGTAGFGITTAVLVAVGAGFLVPMGAISVVLVLAILAIPFGVLLMMHEVGKSWFGLGSNGLRRNSRTRVAGVDLDHAKLSDHDLSQKNLKLASLRDANCRGADFEKSFMADANLRNADCENAEFGEAILTNANLTGCQAPKVSMEKTKAIGVNFFNTNLQDANLNNAKLQNSFFVGTNLKDADLSGANLKGAVLKKIKAEGAKWKGARFGKQTVLPFSKEEALHKGMIYVT